MVGPGRPQFVLFGSSIVQQSFNVGGWGAILADLYCRKADIVLRGYSGWNSRRALEVLHQVFPKDAVVQPSLVIVYFGGNDAMCPHPSGFGTHVPLLEYVENMKKIVNHIKCLSKKTRLIFLTSPPVNEQLIDKFFGKSLNDQARTNEACHAYAETLVALGKELNIKVINLWTAIQQRDDWSTACLTDGIHFSNEGSKIVVREILKVLKEAEWKPSLYWLSMPTEFPEDSPYYEADIVLRGYAGWNSRNALQCWIRFSGRMQLFRLLWLYYIVVVTMQCILTPSGLGPPHVPLLEYVENMEKISLHLKALSENIRIIFLTSPPVDEAMIYNYYG